MCLEVDSLFNSFYADLANDHQSPFVSSQSQSLLNLSLPPSSPFNQQLPTLSTTFSTLKNVISSSSGQYSQLEHDYNSFCVQIGQMPPNGSSTSILSSTSTTTNTHLHSSARDVDYRELISLEKRFNSQQDVTDSPQAPSNIAVTNAPFSYSVPPTDEMPNEQNEPAKESTIESASLEEPKPAKRQKIGSERDSNEQLTIKLEPISPTTTFDEVKEENYADQSSNSNDDDGGLSLNIATNNTVTTSLSSELEEGELPDETTDSSNESSKRQENKVIESNKVEAKQTKEVTSVSTNFDDNKFKVLTVNCFFAGCNQTLDSQQELNDHMYKIHGLALFKCLFSTCGKVAFRTK